MSIKSCQIKVVNIIQCIWSIAAKPGVKILVNSCIFENLIAKSGKYNWPN